MHPRSALARVCLLALVLTVPGAAGCTDEPISTLPNCRIRSYETSFRPGTAAPVNLLFVIDDSPAAADKIDLVVAGVTDVIAELIRPRCASPGSADGPDGVRAGVGQRCPDGSFAAAQPLDDLRVAVVSASVGFAGGCPLPEAGGSEPVVGSVAYDPLDEVPGGSADAEAFLRDLERLVRRAAETRCAIQAPLEAFYRFAAQPAPVRADGSPDAALLEQRARFLRPSMFTLVLVGSSNDCSLPPEGAALLADQPSPDKLACFDQRRRFGRELTYPVERYRVALTKAMSCPDSPMGDADCDCELAIERGADCEPGQPVGNPLFMDDGYAVHHLISLNGVPWQDVVRPALGGRETVVFSTADQLSQDRRWEVLLGDPEQGVPPGDALLLESVEPRQGNSPIIGSPLLPPETPGPLHPGNGHERRTPAGDDLQYACIFPLPEPRVCSQDAPHCDCGSPERIATNPVCQHPETGAEGSTQYFGKAYPGLRQLRLARELRYDARVGSICPPNPQDDARHDYLFRPAFTPEFERLSVSEGLARCGPSQLARNLDPASSEHGQVPCAVIAARAAYPHRPCTCEWPGSRPPAEARDRSVREKIRAEGSCDGGFLGDCDAMCLCELPQARGPSLSACLTDLDLQPPGASTPLADGWCHVDPAQGFGNEDLVSHCPPAQRAAFCFPGHVDLRRQSVFVFCQAEECVEGGAAR